MKRTKKIIFAAFAVCAVFGVAACNLPVGELTEDWGAELTSEPAEQNRAVYTTPELGGTTTNAHGGLHCGGGASKGGKSGNGGHHDRDNNR